MNLQWKEFKCNCFYVCDSLEKYIYELKVRELKINSWYTLGKTSLNITSIKKQLNSTCKTNGFIDWNFTWKLHIKMVWWITMVIKADDLLLSSKYSHYMICDARNVFSFIYYCYGSPEITPHQGYQHESVDCNL